MSIEITHVRYSGTEKTHGSIVRYAWKNTSTGTAGQNDKPSMVRFVDSKENPVEVGDGVNRVPVGAVHPAQGEPYLRTYADGEWSNNLLNLPIF